jgi:hypothetical protein
LERRMAVFKRMVDVLLLAGALLGAWFVSDALCTGRQIHDLAPGSLESARGTNPAVQVYMNLGNCNEVAAEGAGGVVAGPDCTQAEVGVYVCEAMLSMIQCPEVNTGAQQ